MSTRTRLKRLEASQGSNTTPEALRLLVALLGRRDALFWPWRDWGPHRAAIQTLQESYIAGTEGVRARSQGESNWKASHHQRNELIAAGLASAVTQGGQTTSLIITLLGEALASALVGDRLLIPLRESDIALARLQTVEADRAGGWISESTFAGETLVGDFSEWEWFTERLLPLLTSGAAVQNSDAKGRSYYKLTGRELPTFPSVALEPQDWAESHYLREFEQEQSFLSRLDDCSGRIVIPISVSR